MVGRIHAPVEVIRRYACCAVMAMLVLGGALPIVAADKGVTPIEIGHSYTIESKLLDQTRRINVYLPPSYADSKGSYPVLYLLDGGLHEDYIHVAGIASLAADFRKIREFVLVGIEGIDPIAVSPSLWWNRQSLSKEAAALLKEDFPDSPRRFWMTIADEGGEMRAAVDRVAAALAAHAPKQLEWVYRPMEHETHGTIFHPAALAAVRQLFATAE